MTANVLSGRDRSRLESARLRGFLNATSHVPEATLRIHGFWCWRFRIPLIWYVRETPRSRYGRLQFDLSTTAHLLTHRGLAEFAGLGERMGLPGPAVLAPFEARWDHVPMQRIEELAGSVFRVATRLGNYEVKKQTPPKAIVEMMETIRKAPPLRMLA